MALLRLTTGGEQKHSEELPRIFNIAADHLQQPGTEAVIKLADGRELELKLKYSQDSAKMAGTY